MKHLIKPTAYLTISNVLTRFAAMVFFVILARALSVSDYGLFRYLISISFMYAIIFTGIPTALSKFISEDKESEKEYVSNSIFMMVILFVVLSIIILIFQKNIFVVLFLFAVLVDSFYLGFSRGLLNYVKLSGYNLLENIIQLIILIISYIIYKNIDFTFAVIFFSVSGIISLVIFELFKPELKLHLILSKEKIKKIVKFTIPVTLGSIGWTAMFGINAIFIAHFFNTEQVGYFSVAQTLVQIFTFLPAAIATIILPKISSLKDKSKILKPLKLAVLGTAGTSIIILILLLTFKHSMVSLIFTDKYLSAIAILLPLSIGQICISLHQIYASVFQGLGKPSIPSITISIAAALNIVGSYFLTKNYGIMGAAISNAITSAIALILIVIIFNKKWKTLSKE